MALGWDEVETYWMGMTMIESRETLLGMRLHAYPHMKESDRVLFHDLTVSEAYPIPTIEITRPGEDESNSDARDDLSKVRGLFCG